MTDTKSDTINSQSKVKKKKEGNNMLNEKAVLLLERVIKTEYTNVNLDSKYFDEKEFYYEFKCDEKVSENDFFK